MELCRQILTSSAMTIQQLSQDKWVTGCGLTGDEWRLESENNKSRALFEKNTFDVSKKIDRSENDVADDGRDVCTSQYGKDFLGQSFEAIFFLKKLI